MTTTIAPKIRRPSGPLAALGCLLLGACATDPNAPTTEFGASVRHMIAIQTEDPERDAPPMDGRTAETVLKAYRADVANRKAVEREMIRIQLGK
jgi:hypothetical protein